jgi:hypothetical protein
VAKARAWLLIALFSAVLLYGSASLAGDRLFSAYAYFTDTASDTGNTITAATLAAPTGLTATKSSSSPTDTIVLQWTRPAGSFATDFEIFRREPPASFGPTATATSSCSTSSCTYEDTGLDDDTDYCYQVRAKYLSWTSGFSNEACAETDRAGPPPTTFLLHANNTMSRDGAVPGTIEIESGGGSYKWSSASAVANATTLSSPITVRLVQGTRPDQAAESGSAATIVVGFSTNNCSTVTTLASSTVLIPKVVSTNRGISFEIPASPQVIPAGAKLCLDMTNLATPQSASRRIQIRTDTPSASGILGIESSLVLLLDPTP